MKSAGWEEPGKNERAYPSKQQSRSIALHRLRFCYSILFLFLSLSKLAVGHYLPAATFFKLCFRFKIR